MNSEILVSSQITDMPELILFCPRCHAEPELTEARRSMETI